MTQLWAKDLPLDALVHRFTVGDDPVTDLALAAHDAVGSAAHARGLHRAGLLADADLNALLPALAGIAEDAHKGAFTIAPEQEDCHTAIEHALIAATGDAGKRIHLGRSRNDQVLLALRLWQREHLFALVDGVERLAAALLKLAEQNADVPLPGYTHLRRAMPSSAAQWASAFAEGLVEELEAAQGLYRRLDRCPLGAAAGFGAPLPLEREYAADLLGFARVQRSTVDVQNARGRHEVALTGWLASLGLTLEKLCWDLALYSTEEFGFIKLPDAFTTGSSIMPQKRNPDVVELARATCRALRGRHMLVLELAGGLPSSYHRDFQLLKKPLVDAVGDAETLLVVLERVVNALEFDRARAAAACTDELYAAHDACRRAGEGLPFRDAYREVAAEIADGSFAPNRSALAAPHTGGLDNLQLAATAQALREAHGAFDTPRAHIQQRLSVIFDV
ncbi:MAG: argininosuccinate lyase [Xanthomonadaceae bacterium]|nr:argininosuccinate lyase [Xanthomonadaceae bacterium]